MFGMTIRFVTLAFAFVGFSASPYAADQVCSIGADEEDVLNLLDGAAAVKVGEYQVPVPSDVTDMEFKMSDGRWQFVFEAGGRGDVSGLDGKSNESSGWGGLHSIIFTDQVKVSPDSEVFIVTRECFLGGISVSHIGMKGFENIASESKIVLLGFREGTSVLLYGENFDVFLEVMSRINHFSSDK